MWIRQMVLGFIGLSAGFTVAGGLFAFIIGLGVLSDFADRTHTGEHILLYEDAVAVGGALGNLAYIYQWSLPGGQYFLAIFGIFSGVFVGCWAMALAEVLNVFPIFIRRIKLLRHISWVIISMAVGRGIGAVVYFGTGYF